MEFKLIYPGKVPSRNRGVSTEVHTIRRTLSQQIHKLWTTEPNLVDWEVGRETWGLTLENGQPRKELAWRVFSEAFRKDGHAFAPLMVNRLAVKCELDIEFLSSRSNAALLSNGDLDNKTKSLIDALKIPTDSKQLPADSSTIFTLLEDDSQVAEISVKHSHVFVEEPEGSPFYMAMISVRTRPVTMLVDNSMFW